MPPIDRITLLCFGASYTVALGLELLYQFRPRPIFRLLGLVFGIAGLFAHTVFLLVQQLLLASPFGSLVFLGWILAVFYLYGTLHHRKVAWGLFVLPVLIGITLLAALSFRPDHSPPTLSLFDWSVWDGDRFWGQVHGALTLLAAVGICVAFVASVMYLFQLYRVKAKVPPRQGMKLLSLERLETMNRRAINWAFPLLTAGLLVAVIRALQNQEDFVSWTNPKLLSIAVLCVVCAILVYLRYALHIGGRQAAVWTIFAFVLLLLSLISPVHPLVSGGLP
jgi:ABC-type transport system involved in cytochrome c biogenesis permease subunit